MKQINKKKSHRFCFSLYSMKIKILNYSLSYFETRKKKLTRLFNLREKKQGFKSRDLRVFFCCVK